MERVLITGITSGIGKCIASHLANENYEVIGTYHTSLNHKIKNVKYEYLDVNEMAGFDAIMDKYGYFDVVILNAGILYSGNIEDMDDKQVDCLIQTNLTSQIKITKRLALMFKKHNKGKLIFISSLASRRGLPTLSVYNASKKAINGFAESLYLELAKYHVDVYLIEPGFYQTSLWKDQIPSIKANRDIHEIGLRVLDILKGKKKALHQHFGLSSQIQILVSPLIYTKLGKWIYQKIGK